MRQFNFVIKVVVMLIVSSFIFELDTGCADDTSNSGVYTFYSIGIGDNLKSAIEKLNKHNYIYIKGKATSLETSEIKLDGISKLQPREINEILLFDKELHTWGIGVKVNDMPIDVIHCRPKDSSTFKNWNYYFSTLTGKILSISIVIEDFDPVKETLISKFGNCILNNFCKEKMNFILLYKKAEDWRLRIFYQENIILHHQKTKSDAKQRENKKRENLREAF